MKCCGLLPRLFILWSITSRAPINKTRSVDDFCHFLFKYILICIWQQQTTKSKMLQARCNRACSWTEVISTSYPSTHPNTGLSRIHQIKMVPSNKQNSTFKDDCRISNFKSSARSLLVLFSIFIMFSNRKKG